MVFLENKKILTFFAHPDDEVLAAGGTIAKASSLGSEVHVLIPSTGIHSRRNTEDQEKRESDLIKLHNDTQKALSVLGVRSNHIYFGKFDDNEMDKSSLLSVIYFLEEHLGEIKPDIILTHHYRCTNIDHRICYEAAVTATRPSQTCHIPILCGEIPSSTGYLKPVLWEPNVYVELEKKFVETKVEAMRSYKGESMDDPHPRSSEVLRALAKVRGSEAGFFWAEAFSMIRGFL